MSMSSRYFVVWGLAGALTCACGAEGRGHAPQITDPDPSAAGSTMRQGIPSTPSPANGGSGSVSIDPSTAQGGTPAGSHVGGAGGAGTSGGAGGAGASGGASSTLSPRCKPGRAWQNVGLLTPAPASAMVRFGGVTGDELTIAWSDADGDAFVADRATPSDPFGEPSRVNTGVALAADRVALAPTGTTVVAFRADRSGFVGFSRASRGAGWTVSPGLEFGNLGTLFEGGAVGSEPVLSADKSSLFYLITRKSGTVVLFESRWQMQDHAWSVPTSPAQPELISSDAPHPRRPTGTSADGLTLFFFDGVVNRERAAWRDTLASEFSSFEDVGAFPDAVPDARCTTLYFQTDPASGPSLAEW